jgi:hypothetical protein
MTLDFTVISLYDTKSIGNRRKIDNLEYFKIKIVCMSNNTNNKVKRQSVE